MQAAAALSGSTTPGCGLHFMDMPFSGEDGLVTDKCALVTARVTEAAGRSVCSCVLKAVCPCRNQAILVVSCSEAVETTAVQQLDKCLQVVGPADSSVRTIGVGESAQKFHQLAMSWEVCSIMILKASSVVQYAACHTDLAFGKAYMTWQALCCHHIYLLAAGAWWQHIWT